MEIDNVERLVGLAVVRTMVGDSEALLLGSIEESRVVVGKLVLISVGDGCDGSFVDG